MLIYILFGLLVLVSCCTCVYGRTKLGKACLASNNYQMLVEKRLCGYRLVGELESSSFFGVVNKFRFNDMAFRWIQSKDSSYRFVLFLNGRGCYYSILQYYSPKHPYIYRLFRDDAPGLDVYVNLDGLQDSLHELMDSEPWEEM